MSKRPRTRSRSPSLDQDSISVSSVAVNTTTPPSERNKFIDSGTNILPEVMHCSLPPHRETLLFTSYEDYEVHYLQSHVNRCSECSKNFPTGHLLNLHIEENHDPLAAARRARGDKTFGCFIEDCERKCSTPQKRRLHLIDKHMFPRSYNFYIVNDGIDTQTSMLRPMNSHRRRLSTSSALEGRLRRRSSASQSNPPTIPIPEKKSSNEMDIDELEKSMSALKFVPTSVTRNRNKMSSK
ncbi:Zinc finger C2H2 [Penicillium cf. griseofulvum]|uniref:Zinc finger C2H2 n=1 Tax=Penicillium cf. griseofulvum TaxID=2972120 RepID=A0A9W9INJ1_9EURO|nr:Zinc finger C2H2 [Penicillium cf. griseofulvum]KAJ5442786.1 Zinc finger C2H2 [Penicillium cf. griseofulvum]KAJ5451440.1 Zinc finger C2H2 [Penicillium cf. griseofulvum]